MIKISIPYIILFLISAAMAFLDGGTLYVKVFYALFIITILGIMIIFINRRYLAAKIKYTKNKFIAGDRIELSIDFINTSFFPVFFLKFENLLVKASNMKDKEVVISLAPFENKELAYNMIFHIRGIYDVGNFKIEFMDISSMLRTTRKYSHENNIYVYPNIHKIDISKMKGFNIFNNLKIRNTGIEDTYSIRDNRKYVSGDNIKKVNWKITAKHNELYVKNHDIVSGQEFNLLLNMNKENYLTDETGALEEQIIDICASMVHLLSKKKVISNIFINGEKSTSMEIKDAKSFDELMDFFLLNKSIGDMQFSEFLRIEISKNPYMKNMAILTSRIDNETMNYIIGLTERKRNITIIYSDSENKEAINKLERLNISMINIYDLINGSVLNDGLGCD